MAVLVEAVGCQQVRGVAWWAEGELVGAGRGWVGRVAAVVGVGVLEAVGMGEEAGVVVAMEVRLVGAVEYEARLF